MSARSLLISAAPFRLAPLCVGLLLSTQAHAAQTQESNAAHSRLQLPPLVITAVQQRTPLTVVAYPKEPRQPVPASDAADYLKTIPGFSAIRSGGSNSDPVLRGVFGSRLLLLTDGGQMIGACPVRMDSPSAYIAPETYDRLTVTKGPQTVIWGAGASAGVVRFDREPERFGELGARLHASVLVGSNGRFDQTLDGAVGDDQGYVRVTGNRSHSDDYDNGNGDTIASRWDKWNGDVALGWTPDDDTLIELTAGRGDGEARYAGRGMDGTQFKRDSLGLRIERSGLGGVLDKLEAKVYYNYADHIMDNFRLRVPNPASMMPNPMASQVDRRTLGTRLAATWKWQDVELITGIDAQRSEHRARRSSYSMMGGVFTDADRYPWSQDAVMHNYGLFAESTWQLAGRNRLVSGARLDRASAKDYRQSFSSMMGMGMPTPNPTAGETRTETLPSGFVRYEHDLTGSPTTVYAGVGHVQRFPDYWELFSAKLNGPVGADNAFAGVKPEKTTQLDVGIQYRDKALQAWASAYVGHVRDYILFDYRGMSTQADNIDARIMGGELGVAYDLNANWKTDATLAYAWGKNSSDGEALPQMPPLEARLGLTYQRQDWSAGALWRLVDGQGRVADGRGNVVGQDLGDSAGFAVFSLNGAYRVTQQVKLSAGVDNLFNKNYVEHLNLGGDGGFGFPADTRIDEPGRTLWAKVDFDF